MKISLISVFAEHLTGLTGPAKARYRDSHIQPGLWIRSQVCNKTRVHQGFSKFS